MVGGNMQSGESQNFGNYQGDLGQVACFLSLGFLVSKMEVRKSNLLHRVVVTL